MTARAPTIAALRSARLDDRATVTTTTAALRSAGLDAARDDRHTATAMIAPFRGAIGDDGGAP